MSADPALVAAIRTGLAAAGDPERARGSEAYLKSTMPMYGLRMDELRRITRACLAEHPITDRVTWEQTILELWDGASHREERYAAQEVAEARHARPWLDPSTLPLWRHLVTSGAWWDLVDPVATHLVAWTRLAFADQVAPVVRGWARDEDIWVRRSAILCQVGAKDAVDLGLLADCLEPSLERPEFGLRKACGWALRDIAPRDPDWVRAFVADHRHELSALTLREATRRLPTPGAPARRTVE